MTMKLIRHWTNRAGFKDWPTYDNKPGPDEPHIARCAIPDPEWIKEPPPRTYNKSKTVTGDNIAEKIRDLRLRRNITGKTSMPRLYQKTHPKQIGGNEEVDEAVAAYKESIKRDIDTYKKQEYVALSWVTEALGTGSGAANSATITHHTGASSSSWEGPIYDTQAVALSDHLLTEQEEAAFFSDDEEQQGPDRGPSWETAWFYGFESDQYPADLRPYGPEAYEAYCEAWLEEVQRPPPQDYYYICP